ncbi:unnamed protein product [Ilex paraguariensis]|uniref:SCP domain-containing protein n=1 Tax=Ilex paraguariensis TaxID=185542 RepID=A0ABC8TEL8_9AQUA
MAFAIFHPSHAQNLPRVYLNAHNAARAEVGVSPMRWNLTIARYAQNYARKRIGNCSLANFSGDFGENIDRGSDDSFTGGMVRSLIMTITQTLVLGKSGNILSLGGVAYLNSSRVRSCLFIPIFYRWSVNPNGGVLESLGYKESYRVDVDTPEGTWVEAASFHDILIFNTGHWWWAPSKFDPVKSPMPFFEKGCPVVPTIPPDAGLDMVIKHMNMKWSDWYKIMENCITVSEQNNYFHLVSVAILKTSAITWSKIDASNKWKCRKFLVFFRTQSPRHFEGGDWDQGGSCLRLQPLSPQKVRKVLVSCFGISQVEELFSLTNNGTNVEARLMNQHLYKALQGSGFHMLDLTHMSEFRADARPSTAGGKKHDDCMHWCLPGITDTWNDLLIPNLDNIKVGN